MFKILNMIIEVWRWRPGVPELQLSCYIDLRSTSRRTVFKAKKWTLHKTLQSTHCKVLKTDCCKKFDFFTSKTTQGEALMGMVKGGLSKFFFVQILMIDEGKGWIQHHTGYRTGSSKWRKPVGWSSSHARPVMELIFLSYDFVIIIVIIIAIPVINIVIIIIIVTCSWPGWLDHCQALREPSL